MTSEIDSKRDSLRRAGWRALWGRVDRRADDADSTDRDRRPAACSTERRRRRHRHRRWSDDGGDGVGGGGGDGGRVAQRYRH